MHHGPREEPPSTDAGEHALAALDAALDAVVSVDARGHVLSANARAGELLGWEPDHVVGGQSAELLGPDLHDDVAGLLADPAPEARRVQREIADHHGRVLWAEASITVTEVGGRRVATVFLRDVSAARRTERRLQVEHRLARVLAAARSTEEIARGILEMLALGLGFDHAEFWLVDAQRASLRLSAAWRRTPGGPFGDAARRLVLGRGEDLAGHAWEVGETVCLEDASTLDNLVRADAIRSEGIRGCAALAIRVGRAVTGVVVLARTGDEPLDAELRQTLKAVAVQLGHFGERRVAERRLAEETVALAAV
ncbi:MAG: two-component system, cell cycle sensor histidine kinase and response regulator CckA, partial [Solirubrobacteraceae bacterium]|nr:two-component system, cell cycle sensor histidine kinase and response regulator CckA [Solirubrobacteraceae bacterium]